MQWRGSCRAYKRVNELDGDEGRVNVTSFSETDNVVHAATTGSEVVDYFKGKSIFITGGTGFLGKLITEKLLRSCKDIKKIYFFIRAKKNKDIACRVKEIFQNIVFSELRKVQPDFQQKIVPVYGDLALPNLGLDEKDEQMLINDVNVIFHSAATVKLDDKLRITAQINVAGTLALLTLAKKCKNISSFVYISTAYSNSPREEVEEKLYEPPIEAEPLLHMIKSMGKSFDLEEKSIIGEWKSSYGVTKNIAEYAVKTHGDGLPICIFRPAIVTNTLNEPLKGYIDNFYGSVGVIANAYLGILRTTHCVRQMLIENVPADYVVNACIVAAYKNSINGLGNIKIYNYVSSVENPITIGDFHDLTEFYGNQTPSTKCIWYPCNTLNKKLPIHLFYTLFSHFMPALFFDLYLQLCGTRPWMLKAYTKLYRFSKSLSWYATKEWKFTTNNVQKLWEDLSDIDKKVFPFSMSKDRFNWNEYLSQMNLGVRFYLLKEEMNTIEKARRKHRKLYYLHLGIKYGFISISLFLFLTFIKDISKWYRA